MPSAWTPAKSSHTFGGPIWQVSQAQLQARMQQQRKILTALKKVFFSGGDFTSHPSSMTESLFMMSLRLHSLGCFAILRKHLLNSADTQNFCQTCPHYSTKQEMVQENGVTWRDVTLPQWFIYVGTFHWVAYFLAKGKPINAGVTKSAEFPSYQNNTAKCLRSEAKHLVRNFLGLFFTPY